MEGKTKNKNYAKQTQEYHQRGDLKSMEEKFVLGSSDIVQIIDNNSEKIYKDISGKDKFAIVGIQTRGVEIANRIRRNIENRSEGKVLFGTVDITFHRDDLATRGYLPVIKETRIEFNMAGMTIILVDDVIFTGRTIKAALETLTGFGRPKAIKVFVLVDRGNRELPIQPDYYGLKIDTRIEDEIKVLLKETDNIEDSVILYKK